MSSSSGRAGAALKHQKPQSKAPPYVPKLARVPHRPFISSTALESSARYKAPSSSRIPYRPLTPGAVGSTPPSTLSSPPPPPPLTKTSDTTLAAASTLLGSSGLSASSSHALRLPDKDQSPAFLKAQSAYANLMRNGTFLSETPDWLLSTATAAVPGHQPKWAFRKPGLAEPAPEDAAALEQRRQAIGQVERRTLLQHDMAVRDVDEKLLHILQALPQSFAAPKHSSSSRTHPTRLTMALALAREMAALGLKPSASTYGLLLQICLAEQDDRLAHIDDVALQTAARRDYEGDVDPERVADFRPSEADRLRKLFETASWQERRPDLLIQHKRMVGEDTREMDTAWYGSAEWEVAWGLYEDAKVQGVQLNRDALNALMKLAFISPELRSRVMAVVGPVPNPAGNTLPDSDEQMIELLMAPHLQSRVSRYRAPARFKSLIADLDRVLSIYADFRSIGRLPTMEAVCQIAARLIRVGWSRAAVEMYLDYEKQAEQEIDEENWLALLRGACRVHHAIAMRNIWEHVVQTGRVSPDVGLVQDCQNLAGASGLTDLAIECLDIYKAREIPLQECHYAPIVHAWTQLNDLEAAYYTLSAMRADGVAPLPETAQPIVSLIVGKADLSSLEERELVASRVDEAWYALLDSKAERGVVDVAAANVVMQACLAIPDFVRATETFNEFEALDVTPDLDTYHLLLDAILLRPLSSAELFELLIKSLEDKSLAYTPATYERIIAFLCSQPKDVWERDAFTYLEDLVAETKRQILLARSSAVVGATAPAASQPVFGPTYRTYEVMLRRCVHERDPRALQLQEEMRSFGFAPSAELMAELSVAQLWTGTLPRRKAGGADFDLGVDQHGRTHGAPPKPPRPSSIALDHLPLSEDGKIPPHVRDA